MTGEMWRGGRGDGGKRGVGAIRGGNKWQVRQVDRCVAGMTVLQSSHLCPEIIGPIKSIPNPITHNELGIINGSISRQQFGISFT